MKKSFKNKKGITLIALVVTIIVLIILAGISISLVLGNNGIITKAKEGKEDAIVGQEKEQVELAYVSAAVKKLGDNVTEQDLQDELDASVGTNKTKVTEKDNNLLNVWFYDTAHNYNIDNGKVSKVEPLELHISNYAELLDFANRVNNGELFEDYIVYLDKDIEMETDEWIMIGTSGDRDNLPNSFKGIFEGNNHIIKEFNDNTNRFDIGLFYINDGIIKNFNIEGKIECERADKVYMGMIASSNNGTIQNCKVNITVDNTNLSNNNNTSNIGGITGTNYGTIIDCSVNGDLSVSGDFVNVGGIVGENDGFIKNCTYNGSISYDSSMYYGRRNDQRYIGGIAGITREEISGCINLGTITLNACNGGGIVGECKGTISGCINKGNLAVSLNSDSSYAIVGGICARGSGAILLNCYNIGNITWNGKGYIVEGGGILADYGGEDIKRIENCYSIGNIDECYNSCKAVFGKINTTEVIKNCYYNNEICSLTEEIATGLTTQEMKRSEFVEMLGDEFVADTNNINNGYPILKWQK